MCHCEIELPLTKDGNMPRPGMIFICNSIIFKDNLIIFLEYNVNVVAIIDWDDTLFPNTHFAAHGYTSENQSIPLSDDVSNE